jgi:pre-mRNA-splicing factor CWC22
VKILFQELAEFMGLQKLNERLKDPTLASFFEGLLPRDNPRNCRFAIKFFDSIGLKSLKYHLEEHLAKMIMDSSDYDAVYHIVLLRDHDKENRAPSLNDKQ